MQVIDPTTIVLSDDQQSALNAFYAFLTDPEETVFVLEGYAGCGKSTLVSTLLDRLPMFMKTARLVCPSIPDYEVQLTATTNKAAEALSQISGMDVKTIHSFLGLRVQTDFKSKTTTLIPKTMEPVKGYLLFIDEASYIDSPLLTLIFKLVKDCKVVFIGDRAQLTPVKYTHTPVFEAGFKGAMLRKVMRQAEGNPIIDLATLFRETVETGQWGSFRPDNFHVQRLNKSDFEDKIIEEFTRPEWRFSDSKILAWTNRCVIDYNQAVRNCVKGDPSFQKGDYAVCNSFVTIGKSSLKTDQTVFITDISEDTERYGVLGNYFTLDYSIKAFMPKSLLAKNARAKEAHANDEMRIYSEIEESWIDLRAMYAQTINKAQGSTYGSVFIDLDDIRRCNSGNQIARMMYVAVSRARNHVYLKGDLA